MAIASEAVARLMQYRAAREATVAGQMLMYVQAIDSAKGVSLPESEYRRALQVVNMTNTGSRLGMLPLFIGMRVRLTAKLSAKHGVVQDAVGEVVDIEFDEREFQGGPEDWGTTPSTSRGALALLACGICLGVCTCEWTATPRM